MRKLNKKNRLGIFGGSFDPIHIGHLRFAEIAREIFKLEKVIFIPAYKLPHTYKSDASDYKFRLKITRKATEDNRFFEVSDIESKREEKSYTIDTLRLIKKRNMGKELFFLMGSDSFEKMDTWKDWRELVNEFKHIIAVRPGDELETVYGFLKKHDLNFSLFDSIEKEDSPPEKNINILLNDSLIKVSSTEIRELIRQGKSVKYLICDKINNDIIKYYSEV